MTILATIVAIISTYFLGLSATILYPSAGVEASPVDTWGDVREALAGPTEEELALHPRVGEDNAPVAMLPIVRPNAAQAIFERLCAQQDAQPLPQTTENTAVTAVAKPRPTVAEVVKFYRTGGAMGATVKLANGEIVSGLVKGLAAAPAGHRRMIALRALA